MLKKVFIVFLAFILSAFGFTGCSQKTEEQPNSEVTDLQIVLLNSILYKDSLTALEGKSVEGHDELIDDKYKNNIPGGDQLIDQLEGFTLIDYDYGDVTGFKAAAFTKGSNLVIVYGGTDHWTDFLDDIFAGLFDFSAQDGQAKAFSKEIVKTHQDYDLYITGYSMGGRLCYLGTEEVIDAYPGVHLKKVRTFNGLGVKEALDFTDSNLSNIHNLKRKFGGVTYDYFVDFDIVSDKSAPDSFMHNLGYNHIGTEIRVSCTNTVDTDVMKRHDLFSIIRYLMDHPEPEAIVGSDHELPTPTPIPDSPAPTAQPTQQEASIDFLFGDWSTSDGVLLSFYDDGIFEMEWGYFPYEQGEWYAEAISNDTYYLEMEGSLILSFMSMAYGSADSDYHFEILKRSENSFYLVQVYGSYTAESSPCKLLFTRD